MDILSSLLKDIPIPKVVRIRQKFAAAALPDPVEALDFSCADPEQ